jgi:hypothetical protein
VSGAPLLITSQQWNHASRPASTPDIYTFALDQFLAIFFSFRRLGDPQWSCLSSSSSARSWTPMLTAHCHSVTLRFTVRPQRMQPAPFLVHAPSDFSSPAAPGSHQFSGALAAVHRSCSSTPSHYRFQQRVPHHRGIQRPDAGLQPALTSHRTPCGTLSSHSLLALRLRGFELNADRTSSSLAQILSYPDLFVRRTECLSFSTVHRSPRTFIAASSSASQAIKCCCADLQHLSDL